MFSKIIDKVKTTLNDAVDIAVNEAEKLAESSSATPKEEEWIWMHGYKGTDKDMQCHNNYQYELGKTYHMPDDEIVEKCVSGFHLCKWMSEVHRYYPIGDNNRFFEVAALVRKEDYEERWHDNKLVAKSIKFIRELGADEILEPYIGDEEWTEEHKQLALSIGIKNAMNIINIKKLTNLGYSEAFAGYICQHGAYNVAVMAGSQSDLSMDMKALMILNHSWSKR